MSGCGIISDAWTCVKPAGHNGGHVYEMRHVNDSIAAAEERGRRAGLEQALTVMRGFTHIAVAELVVRELLAPRDSGKLCGCQEAIWYPARHAPTCPRKEET